ncbi:MAG TPA: TonB-dependent hemoglobin/transferrin/lactoferrin family receptor [Roseococcus sp.]|jgi:hemoglobin/transferrin/lactoferrin receptor protein|nr:TonB-dependent hemoglobin/transferrin/lactoferrin family receptor [Roseococcus sp.]
MPHPSRRRRRTPLAIALIAGGLAPIAAPPWGAARAQTAAPDPADVRLDAGMLLPPVNTTALRNERRLFDTPATVDVIPGRDLDERMVRNAEDVFRYTPGVFVNRQTSGTDPFRSLGGITIRGVGSNRVLTLVDGFRTLERITDNTRDVVDPWNLSRVEILRGPGSVLYGSDALGGVVNYITRNPNDLIRPGRTWGGEVGTSWDSLDNSLVTRGTYAVRAGDVSAMLSYQRRDANEPRRTRSRSVGGIWNCPRNPQATPCDRFDPLDISSNNVFGRIVWDPNPDLRLRVTGEWLDRSTDVDQRYDLGPAAGGITNLSYLRNQTIRRGLFAVDGQYRPGLDWLDEVRVMLGYSPQTIERTGSRLRRLANGQEQRVRDALTYSEDLIQGEAQFRSSFDLIGARHVLTYGFAGSVTATDYARQDVTTNLATGVTTTTRAGGFNFANADTRRLEGFLQDEVTLFGGRLTVTPGLRLSNTNISPRPDADYRRVAGREPRTLDQTNLAFGVGAILRLDERFSLYGNYGEGFKMPTAEQLFTSLPSTTFNLIPNPNLRPEQVRSYEAGVRMQLQNAWVSLGAFRAEYTDFIQSFVSIPNSIDITYQNLSEVTLQGIEVAGAWRPHPRWLLQASASWQEGEQRATRTAPRTNFDGARPFLISSGVTYEDPDLGLRVSLNNITSAGVTQVSDPQRYRPPAYTVFDLTASWRPIERLELNAGIFNLLNARYVPLAPGGTAYNQSRFTTDDTKRVNPIELQVAPGTSFRLGARYTF